MSQFITPSIFFFSLSLLILSFIIIKLYRRNNLLSKTVSHTADRLLLEQNKHSNLFNNLLDATLIINQDGIIQNINPAVTTLFGYHEDELLNKNINILMASSQKKEYDSYLKKYMDSGKSKIIGIGREIQALHKEGNLIPLILSVSKFTMDGDVYFLGTLRDIAAQKAGVEEILNTYANMEKEVEIRTKELSITNTTLNNILGERNKQNRDLRLYSKVFNSASDAIIVVDKDQTIMDINPAYSRITGYHHDEIIGYKPSYFSPGRHDSQFFENMWHTIEEKGNWQGEIWDKCKDGRVYPMQLSINAVYGQNGKISEYVGIFSDITKLKETEKKLESLAYSDPLTNLNNRTMFQFLLNLTYETACREKKIFALLFIDLDQFKQINDTLGHSMGDQLLIEVAQRLKRCMRKTDIISRIGGDEFTVILANLHSNEVAALISQKIIDTISEPIQLGEHSVQIGASIGISIYPQDGKNVEILSKHADIAMYHVKESGRNGYQYFDHSMFEQYQNRLVIEEALRDAIEKKQFELYYQPKINIKSGEITGAEALIRWNHPEKGLIPPFEFIPLAESSGLIIPMGEWIIRQACKQLKQWQSDSNMKNYRLAINLSPLQFQQDNLTEIVKDIMYQEGIVDQLDIEVTESMLLHDIDTVIKTLNIFKKMNVGIALDDFGTGFSSLSNLKLLPIQYLKIDRSFIKDIEHNNDDAAIVSAIASMASQLDLKIIAEGVESKDQLEFIQILKCDEAQGYLYSPPLAVDDFQNFVKQYTPIKMS